jgi:hypothetical protein
VIDPVDLAHRLPDVPCWVDTRGMLLSGIAEVTGSEADGGFVVRAVSGAVCVVAIVGKPRAAMIRRATTATTTMTPVICQLDDEGHVADALPERGSDRAILHRLKESARIAPASAGVRLLNASDAHLLGHLPVGLCYEISHAMELLPMAACFAGGHPVSFCYPCWSTETLWDISIDTVEGYRRRGYAADAVRAMIRHMRETRREPVWGAVESNTASLALAAKLGFEPVGAIRVFSPQGSWSFFSGGFEGGEESPAPAG